MKEMEYDDKRIRTFQERFLKGIRERAYLFGLSKERAC